MFPQQYNRGKWRRVRKVYNHDEYFTTIISSAHSHDKTFHHEELWKSEHVLDDMQSTRCLLDAHYEKYDLRKVA